MVEVHKDTVAFEPVDLPLRQALSWIGVVEPDTGLTPVADGTLPLVLVSDGELLLCTLGQGNQR